MTTLPLNVAFRDNGASRGLGDLAQKSNSAASATQKLESAAEKLAAAERKVADAAGQVRVAESRLQQVRSNAKATATQRLQAEEKLASAQRRLTGAQKDSAVSSRQVLAAHKEIGATAEKSSVSVGALGAGAGKLAVGLGIAGVAAGAFGLKVASGNEQARISFTTMLGSAEKADQFLRELQQFAATTPFEFPELQTAASSLISAGIEASKVIPIMRTLGDVTSGMGTGAEGVRRATIALQQMNAAGRITGEDLNQLRDAGIPVYDLLAAATHKSKEEVVALAQAGKLGKRELGQMMDALQTGKGLERFNGLMEKQSQTLAGMISTTKDLAGQMLAGWLTPLFPALKTGLGALNDMSSGAKTTLAVIGGSVAVFGLAAKGALGLSGAFRTLGASATAARFATGGVGAALALATAGFALYAAEHAKSKARVEDFTQALQAETSEVNKSVAAVAAKQLQDAGAFKAAQTLGLGLDTVTRAALGQQDAVNRVNSVIDAYIAAGMNSADVDANLRADAAITLSDAIGRTGSSYNRAVGDARNMQTATGGAAGAMANMEKKTESAKESLQRWRTQMILASRNALTLQGAQDAVQAAIDDATKSVKDNGRTLDNNTEKGRANRTALRNLASSSLDYREKLIEQGAKQKTVTRTTMDARDAFIKTAIKMGSTRKEAERLADKFGLVDKKINDLNNKTVSTKVTFSVKGDGFKIHIPNSLSVVKDMGGAKPGPRTIDIGIDKAPPTSGAPLTVTHSHGNGPAEGGPIVHPKLSTNTWPDPSAMANRLRRNATGSILRSGTASIKAAQDKFTPALTAPGGSYPAYSAGQAATIARLRAAGARSFTTYPGHHPSMARARDVTPHNWKLANMARASSGVWYVIYQMRIASKNHGNNWRPYHPINFRGDWQHRQHIHVAWYDKGGRFPSGSAAVNSSGQVERVLTGQQNRNFERLVSIMDRRGGAASTTYIFNIPNYVGSRNELRQTMVDMARSGEMRVVTGR